ncbi:OmpA family protein [Solirubrobacter sp. CPCC 204708]|uniref:OmpA family protein n=1 Tax=Solirubrobacter deserti TaxID=2282478 RepID=A0ABT4RMF8_9ACTN|nr:flagellar motor protein MotB [Solirubrobacter deserti]MBE2316920.1 OmpA family protein [Solirubrobacter deserti]MDA0139751.1 OmpA family protein [Solirubrobacter deserti]
MASNRRHKGGHHEEEHENEERWLVSFADMMTLLFALFMVLFSISSVNTSKFEALQKSLNDAFSGAVLDGGKSMLQTGSSSSETEQSSVQPPLPALRPLTDIRAETSKQSAAEAAKASKEEEQDFRALKRRIDNLAKEAGLDGRVKVTVRRRGLVIQLLTDKVFFDSGRATLKPGAKHLVEKIAQVVRDEREHPVVVEGHTDSQPISGSQYPSNWELSGARAGAVIRDFVAEGVNARRVSGGMYASQEPIDSNSTSEGRAKNRRVEIVLSRLNAPVSSDSSDTESHP